MIKSRTTNTIYNFISSIGGLIITYIMQFLIRTIFIRTLGSEYLGINGLFSNILTMLSLAELGVGSAVLFKLYDPIAKKDNHRILILIKFYKKIYLMIGIVITIIGLCLVPFLPMIINDYSQIKTLGINPIFIYLLYLLQSVSSYLFFAYKSAIIKANQKEYMLNCINYIFTILSGIIQIILLVLFHNFELYVIVLIVNVIAQNFAGAMLANKLYPFIKEKTDDKISKKEIKEILKDCSALLIYKLNGVVLGATDNIIISTILGLKMVGIYSNYFTLYSAIKTMINNVFNSVLHSLGNLHTTHNYNLEYKVFKVMNLIAIILAATGGIGIFCISNEFIKLWLGNNWVLSQPFALLLGIEVYTVSIRAFLGKYRNTMGLFQQAKYRPLFGIIINIIVSVILVKYWGICGVIVGTIIADFMTVIWYDPIIIHKYGFKNHFSIKLYYLKNILYILIIAVIGIVEYFICNNFLIDFNWLSVIIHILICSITVPTIIILFFSKTEEGNYIIDLAFKEIKKIRKAFKNTKKIE